MSLPRAVCFWTSQFLDTQYGHFPCVNNSAPDVFALLVAGGGGDGRMGFGPILSSGMFVSVVAVGFFAIFFVPFSVDAVLFKRDYGCCDIASVNNSAPDVFALLVTGGGGDGRMGFGPILSSGMFVCVLDELEFGSGWNVGKLKRGWSEVRASGFRQAFDKISRTWEIPVSIMLKLTIPQSSPSEWNRFYRSANIALCPLALMYSCKSFFALNHPIVFLLPNVHFPLWLIVLFGSSSLALVHFIVETKPPKTEQMPVILLGFIMSVFWISTIAGELLNCLAALGSLLEVPASLLGLTVLAWGNSVGDLVADVAVAKAGQPAMAMAGCFAGPMFNMLFGLGTALVIQTANVYPEAYELRFHVPRFWGFCLVGLYVFFIAVSLLIAKLQF
nr:cation/calcium exchanger 5 [Tanacetum cinerariifolium]